jgi:hypothetical protein
LQVAVPDLPAVYRKVRQGRKETIGNLAAPGFEKRNGQAFSKKGLCHAGREHWLLDRSCLLCVLCDLCGSKFVSG